MFNFNMGEFSPKERIFHHDKFCCCIPVRAGFVLITLGSMILAGGLSALMWFEVDRAQGLTHIEHIAFIAAAIAESSLFLFSVVGFIGVVARKQLFVIAYAYFIYAHFFLNLVVGIYFLVILKTSHRADIVNACEDALAGSSSEESCTKLLNISLYVYIAIVTAVLLLELYTGIVVSRYVYHLRRDKKVGRNRRLAQHHALGVPPVPSKHSRGSSGASQAGLVGSTWPNPYSDPFQQGHTYETTPTGYQPVISDVELGDAVSTRSARERPRLEFSEHRRLESGSTLRNDTLHPTLGPENNWIERDDEPPISAGGQTTHSSDMVSSGAHSALMHYGHYLSGSFTGESDPSLSYKQDPVGSPPPYESSVHNIRHG